MVMCTVKNQRVIYLCIEDEKRLLLHKFFDRLPGELQGLRPNFLYICDMYIKYMYMFLTVYLLCMISRCNIVMLPCWGDGAGGGDCISAIWNHTGQMCMNDPS